MKSIHFEDARNELDRLIEEVRQSGEPVRIVGPGLNAVLVSDDEWRGIQETLYLLSIPGMKESIIEGMNAPMEECSEDPGW